MKEILFISIQNPYSISSGAHQRTNLIFQTLQKIGNVDVFLLGDEDVQANNIIYCNSMVKTNSDTRKEKYYKHFVFSKYNIYSSNSNCIKKFNDITLKKNYDIIFFRYLRTYLICGAPQLGNMYLDMDDVPWNFMKFFLTENNVSSFVRTKVKIKYYAHHLYGKKLKKFFKSIFFSNPKDAKKYEGIFLPNIPYYKDLNYNQNFYKNRSMIFVGLLEYSPNYKGMDHFLDNIWPIIYNKYPDASIKIVGKGLPKWYYDKWIKLPNVNLLGFVESLSELYCSSNLVVCPIYSGVGTNIKVLEALLYKKLCVLTDIAYSGFEDVFIDNEDLFVCRSDNEFIDKISYAFEKPELIDTIAESGNIKVKKYYSHEIFHSIIINNVL